ncbi:aldehyde dehydrogenase family protein [Spirochaetia bacterium 38H-sp]|uniref:Aldehyde dehydrogenase n=1 Tax=Rarispira pelagica TaxID=3141764 RepID=A0ABU9UBK0_9SPIR
MTEKTVSKNPFTGEQIAEFAVTKKEELFSIVDKAREAQKKWEKTPIKQRIKRIKKIKDYLAANADKIAKQISKENGKTPTEALATEVLPASIAVSYYCRTAKRFLKPYRPAGSSLLLFNKKAEIISQPYGVVGIISPWNYPFSIPFSEVIMALLAGNAVILKTASISQLAGNMIKEAVAVAGLEEGIFNLVNLPGRIAGDTFIEAGIDKLFFTGSVETGRYLAKKAGEKLLPICLELGGNDPAIVLEDANLVRAARGIAWAAFQNAGQSCGGVERVYVQKSVYERFLSLITTYLDSLKYSLDGSEDADLSGMCTIAQAKKVEEHIKDAVEKGARIFYKKLLPKEISSHPLALPPLILTEVNHNMQIMREESFGPVIGVMAFESHDEALTLANDSSMGLTASVWTGSKKFARYFAENLEAGVISINDHLMSHGMPELSWGGWKDSGIGWTHGRLGFAEFVRFKNICDDRLGELSCELWWPPYRDGVYRALLSAIKAVYGRGFFARIGAWLRVAKAFIGMLFKR